MIGKLNYKRLLLLATLPAFMLASCSQEETPGEPGSNPDAQNGEIRFEIGFSPQNGAMQTDAQTRVATDTKFNSTWEEGDEIGIFAVEHDTELATSGNYIHNVKLTYTDGKWAGPAYWPTLTSGISKLDFYAYHPYDAAATDPMSIAFNVHTDQSATTGVKSNYNLSDLLMAKNDNSGNGYGKGETVKLSFTHALAMVQVDVSKSMIGDYPADMLKVWLNGCTTDGVLNLSAQSTTPPTNPAPPVMIKMYPCPNDDGTLGIYAYRALVPVQEIATGTVLFSFEYDGSTLLRSKPLAQPLSLVAGTAETFDMTFPFTSATANVSSNVRLNELFSEEELGRITHLKVMGEMTQADFKTIKEQMPAITSLDLGGATVVGVLRITKEQTMEGDAIPKDCFMDKNSLQEFIFPRNIKAIGSGAFKNCIGLTGTLTIPAGVTEIFDEAFGNCTGFTGLSLPEGLKRIKHAFDGCTGFTGTLTIPGSLWSISSSSFPMYAKFSTVHISSGIVQIEEQAFSGWSNLATVTIPASVTVMEKLIFENCTSLSTVICHITDLNNVSFPGTIFNNVPGNLTIYVPETAVEAYQVHPTWNSFKIEPIPAP